MLSFKVLLSTKIDPEGIKKPYEFYNIRINIARNRFPFRWGNYTLKKRKIYLTNPIKFIWKGYFLIIRKGDEWGKHKYNQKISAKESILG
jgi:hypothetical protein